jgi:hypothetical protein
MRRTLLLSLPVLSTIGLQAGCYRYVPMAGSTPVLGDRYTFEITDAGRVGLGDRLGSGVARVEGTLVRRTEDSYVVSVAGIDLLNGTSSHWTGEQVPINAGYVSTLQKREFSRGRTAAAVGAAVIAIGAFIVTRGLGGTGAPPVTGGPPPGGGT